MEDQATHDEKIGLLLAGNRDLTYGGNEEEDDPHRPSSSSSVHYPQQPYNNNNNTASGGGRHARAATIGGFSTTTVNNHSPAMIIPGGPRRHPNKSSSLTAVELLGRQELFIHTPFTAVFGLHTKEQALERTFADLAASFIMEEQEEPTHHHRHRRQTSEMILQNFKTTDAPKRVVTWPFLWAILVATTSQFSVGYNTGVMNAPEKVVFPGHSTGVWSLAVASFAIGGPLGAFLGGQLADSRGRRGALLINVWTFLLGGVLQTCAMGMPMIVVSRLIIGFSSGFSSVVVPVYLGELAPPRLRGALGTLTQFAMVIGILVADLLAFPFATIGRWRFLFAVTPIMAALQIIASPYLLESPRWLLNQDPKSIQAHSIIKRLRGIENDEEVEQELSNYLIGEAAQHQDVKVSQYETIQQMFRHDKMRLLLISSFVLQISQQLGGINAVFYYSTSFFEGVIDNPLVGTTIVGAVNVVATYIALLLMDSTGRRTLILWSAGGMFLSCVVIVLSLLGYLGNMYALAAVNTYVTFFEIGLGPIPWLIVAEMFEGKYVAIAMSLCSQLNWFCNFIVGLVFPWMNVHLGAFSFGPFALVLAFCFGYAYFILPETQGTTPEKLMAEMVHRHSLLKESMVTVEEDGGDPKSTDSSQKQILT